MTPTFLVAEEMQSGCDRRSVAAVRHAVVIEHVERADERLESGRESGRRDDRVRQLHGSVIEPDAIGVDRGHPGHDLHATALDRLDDIRVDDRGLRVVSAKGGKGSLSREVKPVGGEIANGLAPDVRVDGVRDPRRQSLQCRREQVVWLQTEVRRTMCGDVRTASRTFPAPPQARAPAAVRNRLQGGGRLAITLQKLGPGTEKGRMGNPRPNCGRGLSRGTA
jgi:hypothetical protein